MRWFYIVMLVAIIAVLFSALAALMKPGERDGRIMLKALTARVGLSILLFIILIAVKAGSAGH